MDKPDRFPEVMEAIDRLRGRRLGALQETAPNVFETRPGHCVCRDGAVATPADHWPTCPKRR